MSGSMMVCVNRATALALKDGEQYYVQINFPEGPFKKGTVVKTSSKPMASMEFNQSAPIVLQGPLNQDSRLSVTLFQSNKILRDEKIGTLEIGLEPLVRGENIDFEYGAQGLKDGKEVAKIAVRISWEEKPAELAGGGTGADGSPIVGEDGQAMHPQSAAMVASITGNSRAALKPLPPCKGQDYTIRVHFHKARQLQSTDDDQEFNTKGTVTVNKETESTDVVKQTQEPVYDQEVNFTLNHVNEEFWNKTISVSVVNTKGFLNNTVGTFEIDIGTAYRAPNHFMRNKWVVLRKSMEEEMVMGFLKISVAVLNLKKDPFPDVDSDDEQEESEEAVIANLIATAGAAFESVYLYCDLVRAMDLPQMDLGGTADPYVKLIFGRRNAQSSNIKNTLEPHWNTQLQLAILLPSLAQNLIVQLWDYDNASPDDIIGTEKLRLAMLEQCGRITPGAVGMALSPQWINFYGHPRGEDADFNKYYKSMARGERKGIDYRGRMLMRILGSKNKYPPQQPEIVNHDITVNITAEIMNVNMVPHSGKYKVRVSCGKFSTQTQIVEAVKMKTPKEQSTGLYSVYFGEKISFNATFPCVVPEEEHHAPLEPQIPSVLFQLVEDELLGSFSLIPGKVTEVMPVASTHFPASDMLTDDSLPDEKKNRMFYRCKAMRLTTDPDKISEGAYPGNPIIQLSGGVTLLGSKPPHASIPVAPGGKPRPWIPVLSGEVMRPVCLDVFVYQARDIPAGDENGLSDPYVVISWGNYTARTGIKMETLNPTYNEAIRLTPDVRPQYPDVLVELWDYDMIGRNTFLAKGTIPYKDILGKNGPGEMSKIRWVSKMTDSFGNKLPGTSVLLAFKLHEGDPSTIFGLQRAKFLKKIGSKDTYSGFEIPEEYRLAMKEYTLSGEILGLRQMRKFRLRDLKKPSLEIECAGYRATIGGEKGQESGPNPDFKAGFRMHLTLPAEFDYLPNLNVRVQDKGVFSKNVVGAASIPLREPPGAEDGTNFTDEEEPTEQLTKKKSKKSRGINPILTPGWRERCRREAEQRVDTNQQLILQKKAEKLGLVPTVEEVEEEPDSPREGEPQPQTPNGTRVSFKTAGKVTKAFAKAPKNNDDAALTAPLLDEADDDAAEDAAHLNYDAVGDRPSGEAPDRKVAPLTATGINAEIDKAMGDDLFEQAKHIARQNAKKERAEEGLPNWDTESETSTVAGDEPLWFDRFDAGGSGLDLQPEQTVTRLGKLHVPNAEAKSLEQVFGPFNDDFLEIPLARGWGAESRKAGVVRANFKMVPNMTGEKPSAAAEVTPTKMEGRVPINFTARVYIIGCNHLTALDSGPLGKYSDPYVVMTLGGGGSSRDKEVIRCKDEGQFQTLDPEFFFMKEMSGDLRKHPMLTISVMDYDKIGRDEEIGFTEISLEDRWYSNRGYQRRSAGWAQHGCYTETRQLVSKSGQSAGSIELWVDMWDSKTAKAAVPRPIDVAPPPPIELELRACVWNTRDVVLVDKSMAGEEMTDIYVRCFMDGMQYDMQNTDVHYRSLDGTGNFNWRMVFPMMFDPRTKQVMTVGEKSKLASLFSVRKEKKKLKPLLHVQIFDNDLLPGSDDFIGEVALDLLGLRPSISRRNRETLLDIMYGDVEAAVTCNVWPCNKCCPASKKKKFLSLKDRQNRARTEMVQELQEQERQWNAVVDEKIHMMKEIQKDMTPDEERRARRRLKKAAKKDSLVNVYDAFLPQRPKSKPGSGPAFEPTGVNAAAGKIASGEVNVSETSKYWFACRGPCGGGRVGDVQMSFQLARVSAFETDESLPAGKGRSDPHALPEPNRPDSSFFWLSSPWKSAVHILWKNYKWYFITLLCIVISALFLYVFFSEGLEVKAQKFFS